MIKWILIVLLSRNAEAREVVSAQAPEERKYRMVPSPTHLPVPKGVKEYVAKVE
jgi:hypothetical protein